MNECIAESKTTSLDEATSAAWLASAMAACEFWRRHDERVALEAIKRVLGAALPGMIEQAIKEVADSRARETQHQTRQTA